MKSKLVLKDLLQAGCPSCHPKNSIKALKEYVCEPHIEEENVEVLSLRFSGHFLGEPGLAGVY